MSFETMDGSSYSAAAYFNPLGCFGVQLWKGAFRGDPRKGSSHLIGTWGLREALACS